MTKHDYQFEIVTIELPEDDLEGDYSQLSKVLKRYGSEGYRLISTETLRVQNETHNPAVLLVFERDVPQNS